VFDISDTNNIVKVAYYDTYENTNYAGYDGCWGVYPYLESGNIIASDTENGLYMISITGGVLPLGFIAFDAIAKDRDARLSWKVTTPEDGERFFVEYSRDGVKFESLAQINAKHGMLNYQWDHVNAGPGTHFYKINAKHLDGSVTSTAIRNLSFDMDRALDIYPTLVSDILTVDTRDAGHLVINAIDGKQILQKEITANSRTELALQSLPTGQYYIVLHSGENVLSQPFTKL
jgi:hypothetical protein